MAFASASCDVFFSGKVANATAEKTGGPIKDAQGALKEFGVLGGLSVRVPRGECRMSLFEKQC